MNKFTLYRANCHGNEKNAYYKGMCSIASFEELKRVVLFDHVSCEYKNHHRGKDDYISSNCIMMDIDNDHSDDPEDWKKIDDVCEAFPDVQFYYIFSKSHMKPKRKENGEVKEPRPKYHIYFPAATFESPDQYGQFKEFIGALFPYFDTRCADIAHFFYAVPEAAGGEYDEELTIDQYISRLQLSNELEGKIKESLEDYHKHEGFSSIPTWDAVLNDNKKDDKDQADSESFEQTNSVSFVRKFFKDHKIVPLKEEKKGTQVVFYPTCPWSAEHTMKGTETETFISVSTNGIINFRCNHKHCDGRYWKDFKKFYEDRDRGSRPKLIVKKMSEFKLEPTQFLFEPYFPLKLVIMSAYPGSGKTFIGCKLASAVSRGMDFSDCKNLLPDRRKVIYLSSEDGYEDTIGLRLQQCHADMDNVLAVEFNDKDSFDFSDGRLEDLIKQENPVLMIFDTLQNFIGNVNMNAANETTGKMRALVRLADQYHCCILLIAHFNKNELGSAITRTIGSTDIIGKCRSYLCVGNVPDEDNLKYLSHEKCNVARLGDTILFEVTPDTGGITFQGTSTLKSDDYAISGRSKGKLSPELDKVKSFIVLNMPGGKRKASEMQALCEANGFSQGTVDKAKKALGVRSVRDGGIGDKGSWYWTAPDGGFYGEDGSLPVDYSGSSTSLKVPDFDEGEDEDTPF